MAFCGNCGKEVKNGAKFCGSCGTPTVNRVAVSEPVITSNINLDDVKLDEPDFKGLSNVWAWCLAFVPVMGSVLAAIIVMVAPDLAKYAITIGCLPLFLLFYLLDDNELKKRNIEIGWGWVVWGILFCGFLVGPIYLFSRAKSIHKYGNVYAVAKGKYGYAIASFIAPVGVLLIIGVFRFSDASAQAKLARSGQFVTTFTDNRDGKVYKKITAGSRTWMAENLNYEAEVSECYELEADNCAKYGRLYNWETALKACPAGWRLPLNGEWKALMVYVGYDAGKKLKSKRGWKKMGGFKGNGTDEYGFSALPGGELRAKLGSNGEITGQFYGVGDYGYWWSATELEDDANNAVFWHIYGVFPDLTEGKSEKINLYSVRCVQNQ
jgi:uncharacterized protein (TIGR02145 family)